MAMTTRQTGMPPAIREAYEKLLREKPSRKLDPLNLPLECRSHIRRDCGGGRWQVLYILPNDYKLTVVDRNYEHLGITVWEICVFNPNGEDAGATPLGGDRRICFSDEEAAEHIRLAIKLASWKE